MKLSILVFILLWSAVIKRDFEAAGLVFEAESPVFRNPGDDHSASVFDESIRHETHQVIPVPQDLIGYIQALSPRGAGDVTWRTIRFSSIL